LDLFEWNKWKFAKQDFWIDPIVDTVDRIDGLTVPKEEFIEKYERPELPVVILNLTKRWPAEQRWNREVGYNLLGW
jgi:histone arginine demethylase JMJD6